MSQFRGANQTIFEHAYASMQYGICLQLNPFDAMCFQKKKLFVVQIAQDNELKQYVCLIVSLIHLVMDTCSDNPVTYSRREQHINERHSPNPAQVFLTKRFNGCVGSSENPDTEVEIFHKNNLCRCLVNCLSLMFR